MKMYKSGKNEGTGMSIMNRLGVLILAAAMLITTPAYSFAAATQGASSDAKAAAEAQTDASSQDQAKAEGNAAQSDPGQSAGAAVPEAFGAKSDADAEAGSDRSDAAKTEEKTDAEAAEPSESRENAGPEKTAEQPSGEVKTASDAAAEQASEAAPDEMPALKEQTITAGDEDSAYEVTVSGMLPERAVLTATEIVKAETDDKEDGTDDAEALPDYDELARTTAEKIYEDDKNGDGDTLPYARFFDITITYDGDKVFEPAEKLAVSIDLKDDALKTRDVDFTAVHFDEEANAELIPLAIQNKEEESKGLKGLFRSKKAEEEKIAAFDAESFSVYGVVYSYTVDFYYTAADADKDAKPAEYHMNGGSEMMLSALFEKLGISRDTADIKKLEFTDDSLVSFTEDGSDYRVTSHKPFTSSEALTVTFTDGEVIEIRVEDAAINRTPEGNINWNLDDNGTLTIRLTSNADSGGFVNSRTSQNGWNSFWEYPKGSGQYIRNSVKKVVFIKNAKEKKVSWNNKKMEYMFAGFTELEEVDFSQGVEGKLQSAKGMFEDCKKLKKVTFGENTTNGLTNTSGMFRNCTSLMTDGGTVDLGNLDTSIVEDMSSMFRGCSGITALDLSGWTNESKLFNMQNMFGGCAALKSLTMNNAEFKTRPFSSNGLMLYNIFGSRGDDERCDALKSVDMSNITLTGRKSGDAHDPSQEAQAMFKDLLALETVKMDDTQFNDMISFKEMFADCPKLTNVSMSGNVGVQDAVSMQDMFRGSFTDPQDSAKAAAADDRKYAVLDVSGFGELKKIVNMDGFVNGCIGLEVLNIANLDNSRIKPLRPDHQAAATDKGAAALNIPWGRELGVDTCESLEWIMAENSKVWMTTNSKGTPGNEYFNAATDNMIYYFTQKKMDFYETGVESVKATIADVRDYIDVMTDRMEDNTAGENINKKHDINKQNNGNSDDRPGAGMLPAGNYHMTGAWDKSEAPYSKTFYRISDRIKDSTPTLVNNSRGKLEKAGADRIDTNYQSRSVWGNNDYVIKNDDDSPLLILTYPEAAEDVNGNLHDVIVKINKVTFTRLSSIPYIRSPEEHRTHDSNTYVYDSYKRPVLKYGKGKLELLNYVFTNDGQNALKGDSGTDIDFTIDIKDALPDTSVLFYMDDLDVAAKQTYINGKDADENDDACYDLLKWSNVSYDGYSEGIKLGDGNDLATVALGSKSGIKIEGNYVHGTGSDPSATSDDTTGHGTTAWSAFSVKADADRSHYTWTSGIGCTTELLRPTKKTGIDPVQINPSAVKTVNNSTPTGDYTNKFSFTLQPAKENIDAGKYEYRYVDDGKGDKASATSEYYENKNDRGTESVTLSNSAAGESPVTKKNNGEDIKFDDTLTYEYEQPGEKKAKAYIYRLKENIPDSADEDILEYNSTHVTYFMKVVVSNPMNDLEMSRGVKAEVTIGRFYADGNEALDDPLTDNQVKQIDWDPEPQVVWSDDANEHGQRQQETRYVAFPKGSTSQHAAREVKVDQNGVKYIKVPAAEYYEEAGREGDVYLNADNPYNGSISILVETKVGDIYPYDKQSAAWKAERGHADKPVAEAVKVDDTQVKVDKHGQMYIKGSKTDGGETVDAYYAVTENGGSYTKGSELDVTDGSFNPNGTTDRDVYADKKVDGNTVYEDAAGNQYYKDGTAYKSPEDKSTLTAGTVGDVLPKASDVNDTKDVVDGQTIIITHTDGKGYQAKVTSDGKFRYYVAGDGKYYSLVRTILTQGQNGFNPDPSDRAYKADFDIFVDDKNTEDAGDDILYYKSDGKYYELEGHEYTPVDPGSEDRTQISIGSFNNRVKTSDISVTKDVVDGNVDDSDRSGTFEYQIEFTDSDGNAINFEPKDYQFTPSADTKFVKKSKGVYTFRLDDDQRVMIYGVPFQTRYKVTELLSDNGWEFVKATEWDDSQEKMVEQKSRSVSGKITVERQILNTANDNVTPNPDYKGQYDHSFTNRFTEVLVDKEVIKKPTDPADAMTREYEFSAEVSLELDGYKAGEEVGISYGWMQEAENQKFWTSKKTADSDGKVSFSETMTFKLKHGEDISLVVPDGATVEVTETTASAITSVAKNNEDFVQEDDRTITDEKISNGSTDTLHFSNQFVTPVAYDGITVKKVISNHSFMRGYEFEMALVPIGNAPMPKTGTKEYDDGIYLPAFISTEKASRDTSDGVEGYQTNFGKITFTNDDMEELVNGQWKQADEKTFSYIIRELPPQEGSSTDPTGDKRAPGLTYSTERYQADVTVKLVKDDAKLELVVEETTIYKLVKDAEGKWVKETDGEGAPVKYNKATITNTYDPNQSAYRMAADKVLSSTDNTKQLKDGDYTFIMKPVGANANKAPMPKDRFRKEGGEVKDYLVGTEYDSEEKPYFRAKNLNHMVRFLNNADPEDGLVFNHEALNHAGFKDNELAAGVDFDYEIYEEIPDAKDGETKVNNNDGTWSISDADGNTTVYDGIHHIRRLTVKLIDNPDYDPTYTVDPDNPKEEDYKALKKIISLNSAASDNAGDFFIDKDGEEKNVSQIGSDYHASEHHTMGGSPIFHNSYFKQEKGSIKIVKHWDDEHDQDSIRPKEITVKVKGSTATSEEKTVILKESATDGVWSATVEDLPVYANRYDAASKAMKKIRYTVTEVQEGVIDGTAEGYTISYVPWDEETEKCQVEIDPAATVPVTVTVTNKHVPIPGEAGNDETWGLVNEPQKGTPNYHVVQQNHVTPYKLTAPEEEGWTINDGGDVATKEGVGTYTLNKDGTITFMPAKDYVGNPKPVTVNGRDKQGNEKTATYTPHVVKPEVETETVTRTIHFTYEDRTGRKVTEDVEQSVTISRTVTALDPKTGAIKSWSEWTKGVLPAVDNPDDKVDEGWETKDKVEAYAVTEPKKIDDVYVIYHKKVYTVTYKDGDHGKSSGGSEKKEYGSKPQSNNVTPEPGWKPTGEYSYVITDENGAVISTGTTKDPESITVTGNITFTPSYEQIDYTVTYLDGDHGRSDGGSEKKHYGDTPQSNKVTPEDGYRFTGEYSYVITDENGRTTGSGKTKDPASVKVTGNITFTPSYERLRYKVTYEDGDHGSSTGGTKKKYYGDTPQKNKVKPDSGWKFTGKYKYVITDLDGKVIKRGTTSDPSKIKVTGNITFTPSYEKVKGSGSGSGSGSSGSAASHGVRTGDSNALIPIAGVMAAALAALIVMIVRRRRS